MQLLFAGYYLHDDVLSFAGGILSPRSDAGIICLESLP